MELKEARKARGLTQADVRGHLGISKNTYVFYERDPAVMPAGMLLEACRFIGVDPATIEVRAFAKTKTKD